MGKIIEFENINFGYNNTNCFNEFNMDIEEGDIVSLIGPSGSGKTTLLKMLCHQISNNGLKYKGESIESYPLSEIKNNIVVVFDHPLKTHSLKNELSYYLSLLNYSELDIEHEIDDFISFFGLENLFSAEINNLIFQKQALIKILRYLIIRPEFLAIDSLFSALEKDDKEKIIDFIKKNHITLLNVTSDLNDTLFGNKICVLENFVLILEGTTLSVLKTDTLLKRLGFKLPLAVDLSLELIHYDVLKKVFTDDRKLVNELWK